MAHLDEGFLAFLRELSENNRSDWFDENRKRYERDVKRPFAALVGEMIERIAAEEPAVRIAPGEAIFRINRDTRFSKDKSPYNAHVAANISPFGRKSKEYPGFYFQFTPEKAMIVGGAYAPGPESLLRIRNKIAERPEELERAGSAQEFVRLFGQIEGERAKRLPPELARAAESNPLVANKQFYFMAELPGKFALREDLVDVLMDYYRAGRPVNEFLQEAVGGALAIA
jgi:uncharacterized protein (TIGR02453 family)